MCRPKWGDVLWFLGRGRILNSGRAPGPKRTQKGSLPKRPQGLPRRPRASIHSAGAVNSLGRHFAKNVEKKQSNKKVPFLHPRFKAFWCRKALIFNNCLTILKALLHNFLKKRDPSNSPPLPTKSRVRCWNKPINTWLVYAFWAVFEPWRRARGRV